MNDQFIYLKLVARLEPLMSTRFCVFTNFTRPEKRNSLRNSPFTFRDRQIGKGLRVSVTGNG